MRIRKKLIYCVKLDHALYSINCDIVDLDQPYSRDCPISPWKSERIWRIECDLTDKFFNIVYPYLKIWIKLYLFALSTFM